MIITKQRKNGEIVKYNIDVVHYAEEVQYRDYYSLTIPTDNPEVNAGKLTFKNSDRDGKPMLWLLDIKVPHEYAGLGNGTALLEAMEYMAYKQRVNHIEGKFYPHDTTLTKEQTIEFYKKNGYDVELDDYDKYIYKYVYFKDVAEKIEPNVSDFFVREIVDGSESQQDSEPEM